MKSKKFSITLLIIFSLSFAGILGVLSVVAKTSESGLVPLEELAIMDLTHENFAKKEAMSVSPIVQPAGVGDEYTFMVSDDGLGIDYPENFTVVLEGEHILILIERDAYESFDGTYYYFENPYGTYGRYWDLISHDQLEYLVDEFDYNIYPTNTEVFGFPNSRPTDVTDPDYEDKDKIWTLLFNIRDDAYYSSAPPSYIAGYFSLADSNTYQKNIMHIDTYDWANRVGPGVARPYLYEGVFAHEFEHMIHSDIDSDEPSWTDEGCADLAMYLCGYGHSSGHIANYFNEHFWTPLTFWGGGLADYGASYLFALYLYEKYAHFDPAFFTDFVNEPANGIEGVENTLAAWGYSITFEDLFDDWTIANYLDDPTPGSLYGYDTLNVGTIDTWGYSIEYMLGEDWYDIPVFGSKDWPLPFGLMSSELYGVGPQPYTAQYWRFGGPEPLRTAIDGDETAGPYPYSGDWAWYSDVGAWAWRSFYQDFSIPATGATLNFYTYFEIEDDWDYGYIEVFDHDTGLWTTLEAPGMVDYIAHPQDNPNCPDGREPTDYEAAGEWHAFTGNSGGWIPISIDLPIDVWGHTIDLYFTTWQDGAFTLQMMYVDDIEITNGVFNLDDVEAGPDGWMTTGWYIYKCYEYNNYQATLIETVWQPTKRYPNDQNWHARTLLNEWHMVMDFATQSGEITNIPETPTVSRRDLILIVSNRADHILPSDYWIEFTYA